jgi:hypothetical protein
MKVTKPEGGACRLLRRNFSLHAAKVQRFLLAFTQHSAIIPREMTAIMHNEHAIKQLSIIIINYMPSLLVFTLGWLLTVSVTFIMLFIIIARRRRLLPG